MFIIWGTTVREKPLGAVADYCHLCDDVRAFSLREFIGVPHLYYIPVGRGVSRGVIRTCLQCRTQAACTANSYPSTVADKHAVGMPVQALLERTNPQHAYRLAQEQRWKQAARQGDEDAARRLALALLQQCAPDNATGALEARLEKWDGLPSDARRVLAREVEAHAQRQAAGRRVAWFVHNAAQKAPKGAGCLPTILIGIPLVILGFAFLINVVPTLPEDWRMPAGLTLFISLLIVGIVMYVRFRAATYRRFFRQQVIAAGEAMQLNWQDVAAAFDELRFVPEPEEPLREMLKYRPMLVQMLESDGKLPRGLVLRG